MGARPVARKDEGECTMSERNAKKDRKLQLMTEEADARKVADEQAVSIHKMYEDMDKKAWAAKNRLVSQLEVTVEKYRTANGVMSALSTLREVSGNHPNTLEEEIEMSKTVASKMAEVTQGMANKAYELDPNEMDRFCDSFYDKEFSEHDASAMDMVLELMILQLCQNVGPSAEDIVEFIRHTNEEIDKAKDNLETFCKENGIDYLDVCGMREAFEEAKDALDKAVEAYEKTRNACVLCDSCCKECRDATKLITDGESAYDVCEDFESISFE